MGASEIDVGLLDLADVERLAAAMLGHLPAPLVIGLVGTLGAGKTSLVQAIARAAGIDSADVTSPTFTLLQTHRGSSLVLHHLDAYRLADEDEFLQLGVEELFEDAGAWTLVEWADRVAEVMPSDALWIEIRLAEAEHRRAIVFKTPNEELRQCVQRIREEMDSRQAGG